MRKSTKPKATELDLYIGAAVRAKREEQGITRNGLCEMIEISLQQMSKYELGVDRLSASRLYEIAQLLNTPIEAFFPKPGGEEASFRRKLGSKRTLRSQREIKTTLVQKNIRINQVRTTARMESEMWVALERIAEREGKTVQEIYSYLSETKPERTNMTSALRVFVLEYLMNNTSAARRKIER